MDKTSVTKSDCRAVTRCVACDSMDLELCLDLGQQPLANNYRDRLDKKQTQYPLAVNRCTHCDHLQLTHVVNPEIIYRNYLYVSGTSQTNLDYMDWYAGFVCEHFTGVPVTVLDIGCNDGSQLTAFKKLGSDTYGVDPAENLHAISSAEHQVVCGFWNKSTAYQLGDVKFDIITNQNAFSHLPDPLAYLKLAAEYLDDDGLMFISTSQANMVLNGEFDTIYHEHISFYNAQSMKILAERAGLHLVNVVKTPIHGVSYVFVLCKQSFNRLIVENILAMEQAQGLHDASTYLKWSTKTSEILSQTAQVIAQHRDQGYRIVGYGAAAKGMTLLNAADINLDVIVDDNPLKQGLYTPGVDIPIVSSDYISNLSADDFVLFVPLAWNFYDEIVTRIQRKRLSKTDGFLRYFPEVEVQ